MVECSTIVCCFRWLFSWRIARRILIGFAWLVTVIALFHGEENWRGRHAWNQYRRTLEAQGEPLDYRALIPKPIPDDENFAATPVIKSWFEGKDGRDADRKWDDGFNSIEQCVRPPRVPNAKASRYLEDLAGWEAGFAAVRSGTFAESKNFYSGKLDVESRAKAAPAVLEGLRTNEALFAELRLASQRPGSRYPIDYNTDMLWTIRLPHISMVRGVCQRLRLKACAELAVGQSEQALEDLRLVFYLGDSVKSDACLISALLRFACLREAAQPIWEGLAEHRWSDAQLQELESRLLQYRLITDTKPPFDAERAMGVSTIEFLRHKGPAFLSAVTSSESTSSAGGGPISTLIGWVIAPRGWYYLEELNYCQGFQGEVANGVDFASNRFLPAQVKANAQALEQTMNFDGLAGTAVGVILRHQFMSAILLPALNKVIIKAAAAQTAANEAAIACALERYRLTNKHFPEKLDALAPQFLSSLPNDVLTGEPYKYHRTDAGLFVLYSIGWDEKDDGGQSGKTLFDEKQGDWDWEYPAR